MFSSIVDAHLSILCSVVLSSYAWYSVLNTFSTFLSVCCSSLLSTFPYLFSRHSVIFFEAYTNRNSQMCLFIVSSLHVTPHTHRSIFISFTSIRFFLQSHDQHIMHFVLSVLSCQRRMGRIVTQSSSAVNPCLGVSCGPTKEPVVSGSSCVCKVDPCSELTCRVQYVAVRVGTGCECRYGQSVGGDVSAGFVDVLAREDTVDETTVVEGGIDLDNLGEVEISLPDEETTTTTARPVTRPGLRPGRRPSRGRSVPRSMIPV